MARTMASLSPAPGVVAAQAPDADEPFENAFLAFRDDAGATVTAPQAGVPVAVTVGQGMEPRMLVPQGCRAAPRCWRAAAQLG